ncbi:NAD-dependent epimerase/dehydratase family protein [Cereibacter azotoformans]|uniref:UDP-glucose 4-epimerase n=1 Tax=Cereibacter sphaeroides (strain ATCC 17025 / ATH 2.4.3) TaxID=349102 RepID=A4WY58_CERS5|nr:NAD-dependent epimerase/dehydratase family protein [Cereibacter azotoformans]ULB11766.1 NAD-dependent epimerase/dehydratase family protein [Cereibacter azotoformans]
MKLLVIGGCGFIGSHVVDLLLQEEVRVRVFDRRPEAFRAPLPAVDYVMGDYTDPTQLFEAVRDVDAVLHLASTTVPATANLNPVADIEGNLVATVRLLDVMRATGKRRLVFLSSGGTVYGVPEADPVPEDHPLRPISSYGIVKVAIENYIRMEQALHGIEPVILRASNPYGPRQSHAGIQGIIGTHLWRAARGEPVEVWGDGQVTRDFIHVRDLAELCVRALRSHTSGCFNAGSGTGTSVAEIVAGIDRTVRASGGPPVRPLCRPGRAFDVPRVVLDISRAREAFGWAPRIGLDEGLAESWRWVRTTEALQAGNEERPTTGPASPARAGAMA